MLWWLIFAVLVAVPLAMRTAQQQLRRRALPPSAPPALASATVGLAQRLAGVDAAIEGARSVVELANPSTAQQCAAAAMQRRERPELASVQLGPGTARFEELLAALAAISPEDRRDLADLGLNPDKIVAAVSTRRVPENWREDLLQALDYWQQGTSNLRARRYG